MMTSTYLIDKINGIKDKIIERLEVLEDRVKALENSNKVMKLMIAYNMVTNTIIALLLWQLVTLLSTAHGGNVVQGVQQGQQIAVVK